MYIYLFFGLIYGIYVTGWGGGRWYMFPVNVLGGPVVALIILYKVFTKKKFYY